MNASELRIRQKQLKQFEDAERRKLFRKNVLIKIGDMSNETLLAEYQRYIGENTWVGNGIKAEFESRLSALGFFGKKMVLIEKRRGLK